MEEKESKRCAKVTFRGKTRISKTYNDVAWVVANGNHFHIKTNDWLEVFIPMDITQSIELYEVQSV